MRTALVNKIVFGGLAAVLVMAPAALLLLPQPAVSTDDAMRLLPSYNKFQCLLCHTVSNPTQQNNGLNAFGRDFRDNGQVWNAALAGINSDGDRCTNGFELGDVEGDGIYDHSGEVLEHSNPGDGTDCSIAVTRQTWGIIKEIFAEEIREYLENETGYDLLLQFP